jgi:hypothetical protein
MPIIGAITAASTATGGCCGGLIGSAHIFFGIYDAGISDEVKIPKGDALWRDLRKKTLSGW